MMCRKDNAVEVFVCLLAVAGFVTGAMVADGTMRVLGFVMSVIFIVIAIAYTCQEERHRRMHLRMFETEMNDEAKHDDKQ